MPTYTYKCVNTECKIYNNRIDHHVCNPSEILYCDHCKKPLQRLFPFSVHVVGVGREKDGKDLGKVTQEKNGKLKEMWSGYSYEQQSIREKVSKQTNEILQKNR